MLTLLVAFQFQFGEPPAPLDLELQERIRFHVKSQGAVRFSTQTTEVRGSTYDPVVTTTMLHTIFVSPAEFKIERRGVLTYRSGLHSEWRGALWAKAGKIQLWTKEADSEKVILREVEAKELTDHRRLGSTQWRRFAYDFICTRQHQLLFDDLSWVTKDWKAERGTLTRQGEGSGGSGSFKAVIRHTRWFQIESEEYVHHPGTRSPRTNERTVRHFGFQPLGKSDTVDFDPNRSGLPQFK